MKTKNSFRNFVVSDERYQEGLLAALGRLPITKATYAARKRWGGAQVFETRTPEGETVYELYLNGKFVIPESQAEEWIVRGYTDPRYGAVGRERFYDRLRTQIVGVTPKIVGETYDNLETEQLHKPLNKGFTIKPILSSRPKVYFQADLIDMSRYAGVNNGYSWVLFVIDIFSKYVWAYPLRDKSAVTVARAFARWLEDARPFPIPKVTLQTDNGPEFKNAVVKALFQGNGVKQIFSLPYSPTSQALVERFNGTIKRMIGKDFTLWNAKIWKDIIQKIVANYNTLKHSATGFPPKELINAKSNAKIERALRHSENLAEKRREKIPKNLRIPLRVGDVVRVSLDTDADYRATDLFRKSTEPRWSRELYRIGKVAPSKHFLRGEAYVLKRYESGETVKRVFFRHQLQKINPQKLIKTIPRLQRPIFDPDFHNVYTRLEQARATRRDQAVERPRTALEERLARRMGMPRPAEVPRAPQPPVDPRVYDVSTDSDPSLVVEITASPAASPPSSIYSVSTVEDQLRTPPERERRPARRFADYFML